MNPAVKMFVVLSAITLVSGAALGGLYEATYELAENNILKFKKIPAVVDIYSVVEGQMSDERRLALEEKLLIEKRFADTGDKDPLLLFPIEKDGKPIGVTLEGYGQGFGGWLGVMVGIDLATDEVVAIGITTMSETPGVGTRVKEPKFVEQFTGLGTDTASMLKKDGGELDAVSGATISSRAVAAAVQQARDTLRDHKQAIVDAASAAPASPAAQEGAQ